MTSLWSECSMRHEEIKRGKLNVAVTGKAGAGKSSFINAVLGLKVGQPGAAYTDVKECTDYILSYHAPNFEHIVFWDLPGIGTDTHNKNNYVKKLGLLDYDFYLVMGSERLTDDELWLANIIRNSNKKFYFVRTKVHDGIKFDVLSRANPRSKEEILTTLRTDCYSNLRRYDLTRQDIYLIDNFKTDDYDFSFLMLNLEEESLQVRIKYVLAYYNQKERSFLHQRKVLLETIENVVVEATTKCKEQTPELGASLNIEVLLRETKRYMEQFERSSDDIEKHEELTGWHKEVLQDLLTRNSVEINCSEKGVLDFCKNIELCELIDVQCAMPTKSNKKTKSWSFKIAFKYLNRILDILYHNALKINTEIIEMSMQGKNFR
ncbi:interferon-gamma-inducible GTPase 10-like isoform X2 [Ruditapes philippinarum]|uniref:interferon-gamma-inducible GTPase 10-like isoform X2 n=1 Tax=Ruditapes philippinarum TaxID=129788 RepID=UPI00295BA40B|nr:interferon-gamma-inducible GTPase 10-like isoform X2 [Ruditapes philippinarum]XP_060584633.1 interferon-gamma-inducible GTPase 10-like isoform X2 [Ruditapes philippinarum]XP_060584634.1 interferon-gamma-inducible GTPase 10-like isoform X2 [Ruditapes philippinarum]XP_060584635.1 interferon-gamma-inducible GTPase 10-like isoform X2 [Ruditapes philippinarum]XP_060584637.1 interferon-gamma-inducible GTPase 10-like isoform X2 [Ruditapes philippinarum]XP_060584638.1 interferon-gamma-inducible GTP